MEDIRNRGGNVVAPAVPPAQGGPAGVPGPEKEDWIDFLRYLARERLMDGAEVVDVVEKPWKYAPEYATYLAAGGVDRADN
jgi:hypothetical protein